MPDGCTKTSAEQYESQGAHQPEIPAPEQDSESKNNNQYWPEAPQGLPKTPGKDVEVLEEKYCPKKQQEDSEYRNVTLSLRLLLRHSYFLLAPIMISTPMATRIRGQRVLQPSHRKSPKLPSKKRMPTTIRTTPMILRPWW